MPTPHLNTGIEFGWNGLNGYVKNNGKYHLLFSKPTFSFQYNSITYNSDETTGNLFLNSSNVRFDPSLEQLQEIQSYVEATAVTSPWEPVLNLPVHVSDIATLTGNGFVKVSSNAIYQDVKDYSTGEEKVHLSFVFVYDVTTTGNDNQRLVTFQINGLNPIELYEMGVDGWTISGGSNKSTHNYRINQTKRMSNDLELIINGSDKGEIVARIQFRLSMFVPKGGN